MACVHKGGPRRGTSQPGVDRRICAQLLLAQPREVLTVRHLEARILPERMGVVDGDSRRYCAGGRSGRVVHSTATFVAHRDTERGVTLAPAMLRRWRLARSAAAPARTTCRGGSHERTNSAATFPI